MHGIRLLVYIRVSILKLNGYADDKRMLMLFVQQNGTQNYEPLQAPWITTAGSPV